MNKPSILRIALLLFVSCQFLVAQDFNRPQNSDYPNLPRSGTKIEDFVPQDWAIVGKAFGDLNRDKTGDAVLVIKANHGRFLNKHEGLGADPFDTNPRVLVILFKEGNHYRLAKQSNTFIIPPDSPTMEDPFQEVRIKNGVLEIDFSVFYSAGSWATSQYSYKFKFLNGEFALIGADRTEAMRNTGEMESQSYNFLTNRVKISTGNFTDDKKEKVRWQTVKIKRLKTLDTFKAPLSWKINRVFHL